MSVIGIISLVLPPLIGALKAGQSPWSQASKNQKDQWVQMSLDHLLPHFDNVIELSKGVYDILDYNGLFNGRPEMFPKWLPANPGVLEKASKMLQDKPKNAAEKKATDETKAKQKKYVFIGIGIFVVLIIIYAIW